MDGTLCFRVKVWTWCLCLSCLLLTNTGMAQMPSESSRFRVDNVVRVEKDEEIVEIKTSTIYNDGYVFDFIGDYGEVIIYQESNAHFTLMDPIHRVQTELSIENIDSFLVRIRKLLAEKNDKFCLFMTGPEFDVSRNEDGSEFLFQSKWIEYNVKTIPFEQESMGLKYYAFSDASSKLNIYLNPGTTTPFARIKINEYLSHAGRFPQSIKLTVYPKGKWIFGKTIKIESDHKIVRRLSEKDQGRIMRALHFAEQFPKLPFGEYQKKIAEK